MFDLVEERESIDGLVYDLRDLLGVDHVAYSTALSNVDPSIKPWVRTTFPADWLKRYLDKSYDNVDPVLRRGYASALPFKWSELEVRGTETALMMFDAIRHGVGPNGLSFPVVSKNGRRGLFSIIGAGSASMWDAFFTDNVKDLTQIAYRIHKRVSEETFGDNELRLSTRELECLAWCARGKEASDMALILGLSIHTVREYLKSARYKLDCSNLPQAVAKAISHGLISVA